MMEILNAHMGQDIQEWTKKICGRQPLKNLKGYGLLSRPYPFIFFKGCLPQTLLGPFLNTLSCITFRCSNVLAGNYIYKKLPHRCLTGP